MAAPRSEPGRGTEEQNSREAKPEATPALAIPKSQGSPWRAWLPLGVALLAMPALAYVTTTFVLVPRMQKALRSPATVPAESGKEARVDAANAGKEGLPPPARAKASRSTSSS